MNWLHAEPAPRLLVLPPDVASLDEAHAAIELWEHYARKTLDPTQRQVVEVMMAQRADGSWAASTTGREMPRQNGKGDEVEVVELWGLVQRAEAIMHTVHDAALLATQTQSRMLGVLEGHPDLRRKVKRRHVGIGQQMIEMRNGGIIWYRTRTGGGGRGVDDIDRLVVDEAQHAAEEHLAALAPTMFANPNPQMNVMGTAGLGMRSDWWWRIRIRALGDDPGAFGYVGHTAETVTLDPDGEVVQVPVNVEDRSLWVAANPATAAGRGTGMTFFEDQLLRLGPASFAREHLCVWDPPPGGVNRVISPAAWRACEDTRSGPVGDVAFGLDVSPQRDRTSIVVAGESGRGGSHIEIVEAAPGTDWAVAAAKRLHERWAGSFVIGRGSPAASLIPALEDAGVRVVECSTEDHARACGALYDKIAQESLRHLGQSELDIAVAGADRRFYGDSWLWARRTSSVDITPLVAATLALWGVDNARSPALSVW